MCFSVEPKSKYYYQEEIIPSRPHRESYRESARDSNRDYYYRHHHHSAHHSPRASHTTVDRYNSSPRVSTYSPRVSTSSVRRTVPTRVVYKETTQSRYT
ncbi:hypothetical protein ACHAQJ_002775 [Trichoderma viride]